MSRRKKTPYIIFNHITTNPGRNYSTSLHNRTHNCYGWGQLRVYYGPSNWKVEFKKIPITMRPQSAMLQCCLTLPPASPPCRCRTAPPRRRGPAPRTRACRSTARCRSGATASACPPRRTSQSNRSRGTSSASCRLEELRREREGTLPYIQANFFVSCGHTLKKPRFY